MNVLLLSANYPNNFFNWTPWNRLANSSIAKLEKFDTTIVAPIPFSVPIKYFPYNNLTQIPRLEHSEEGLVHRPRFLYFIPKRLFYNINGELYKRYISKYILDNFKNIDLIHAHQAYPDGYGMVDLSKNLSVPLLIEIHSTNTLNIWTNNEKIRKKFFKTLQNSNKIICISEELCDSVIKLNILEEKVIHVPLGVDIEVFKPRNRNKIKNSLNLSDETVLIYVGSLIKLKNVDKILQSISKIINNCSNFKLLIVGDGPEKENLIKISKKLNLDEHIKFLGELKGTQLVNIYSLADILILASYTEGRPMVIYEAMASECAIIAPSVGGIPEQVIDGLNGFLFDSQDYLMLENKIIHLLENEKLLKKMKKNSRNTIINKNWTWEGYANRINRIYLETIEGD